MRQEINKFLATWPAQVAARGKQMFPRAILGGVFRQGCREGCPEREGVYHRSTDAADAADPMTPSGCSHLEHAAVFPPRPGCACSPPRCAVSVSAEWPTRAGIRAPAASRRAWHKKRWDGSLGLVAG